MRKTAPEKINVVRLHFSSSLKAVRLSAAALCSSVHSLRSSSLRAVAAAAAARVPQCVCLSPGRQAPAARSFPTGLLRVCGSERDCSLSSPCFGARARRALVSVYQITVGTSARLHVAPHWLKSSFISLLSLLRLITSQHPTRRYTFIRLSPALFFIFLISLYFSFCFDLDSILRNCAFSFCMLHFKRTHTPWTILRFCYLIATNFIVPNSDSNRKLGYNVKKMIPKHFYGLCIGNQSTWVNAF